MDNEIKLEKKERKVGRPKKHLDLPTWKDDPNSYMNKYMKLNFYCETCKKNLALATKSVHLKRKLHLNNLKKNSESKNDEQKNN